MTDNTSDSVSPAPLIHPTTAASHTTVTKDNQPRTTSLSQSARIRTPIRLTVVSPTAQATPDELGLAATSGQRGAEILAGIRSEMLGTPTANALASTKGRIIARFMLKALSRGNIAAMNYLAVRTEGFAALIKEAIRKVPRPIIVEVAAGFSSRGVEMALSIPDIQVIEVDLPNVIQEKQKRLKNIQIPQNLVWKEADLGTTSLYNVLQGQLVDVISAEGLLPYFSHLQQIRITHHFLTCLQPGGAFITDYSWQPGFDLMKEGGAFFSKQAGKAIGLVKDCEEPKLILKQAGFTDIEVHLPTDLANRYNLKKPVIDSQLIVVAKRPRLVASP